MTVRDAIEKASKFGGHSIFTGNGTEIVLLDLWNSQYDCIGRIKMIDGKRVYRNIFCSVKPSNETRGMNIIEKYTMYFPDENGYSYFGMEDYVIPEREMNEFVSYNGGIDVYQTVSVPMYMLSDAYAILAM